MRNSRLPLPARALAGALLCVAPFSLELLRAQQTARPTRFEADIQRILEREKTAPPPREGILFIGSSIFRLWTQLSEQMAPLPVFNHAFGGAVTQDIQDRSEQLVLPYRPRIVVYYCGSNDVNAGESAQAIIGRTKQFLRIVNEKLPDTFVYYTSIQKAPDKRSRWDVVDAVNREMESYSRQSRHLGFIDLNPVLFDHQGNLREDLFLPDKLHFRPESTAYPEFAQVVKPILVKAWESGVGLPKN
jgi:hypothetical protein